jgi:hypothetical protein
MKNKSKNLLNSYLFQNEIIENNNLNTFNNNFKIDNIIFKLKFSDIWLPCKEENKEIDNIKNKTFLLFYIFFSCSPFIIKIKNKKESYIFLLSSFNKYQIEFIIFNYLNKFNIHSFIKTSIKKKMFLYGFDISLNNFFETALFLNEFDNDISIEDIILSCTLAY